MNPSDVRGMSLEEINTAPEAIVVQFLGETLFNEQLARDAIHKRPFGSIDSLVECTREVWRSFDEASKKKAFDAHPRIGDPKAADRLYSGAEQRAALEAPAAIRETFASLNQQYEQKFGYRGIVFASGRSAAELLKLLEDRLQNDLGLELGIASREKEQINTSRIKKAVYDAVARGTAAGPITSPPIIGSWWAITLLYIVSLLLLFAGPWTKQVWPMVVAIGIFTCWDACWIFLHDAERNAQEMLDTSTRARTYMSYFVAIYGAGIVFVLPVSDKIDREAVLAVLARSGAPGWLLISPLVLCAVAMLFFPVKLSDGTAGALTNRMPTGANVAIVVMNAWIQKVSTFVFVYCLLLIAATTWSSKVSNLPKTTGPIAPTKQSPLK